MTTTRSVAALATAFVLLAGPAGASGQPDPTFGDGGVVTTEFHHAVNQVHAIAVLTDGRIVAAGTSFGSIAELALARYSADGELDPSFGTAGVVLGDGRGALDLDLQSDGKIVVVAGGDFADPDFVVLRYDGDGAPDPSFGVGGRVTTGFSAGSNDQANAVVVQPDGRILAAGYTGADGDPANFALARYLADGTPDAAFGSGGRVVTDFGALSADVRALALQSDGKIVAAGRVGDDFALVRYLADGTPDPGFGTGGVVVTDFAGHVDYGRAVVVQPDGKILVAGFAQVTAGDDDFALARYLADGGPDTGFGTGGLVTTDLGGTDGDFGHSAALQADGKIVVGGESGDEDFAVVRYLTDGTVDSTFAGGAAVADFGRGFGRAVAVDGAGGILAAGHVEYDFAVARLLTDGSLDADFGGAGLVTTDLGTGNDTLEQIALQPDGKLVAVGATGVFGTDRALALARYDADGGLDPAFGTGGRVITTFSPGLTEGAAVAVQADGKIVAAGSTRSFGGSSDYAVARYLADGSLDPAFGVGGRAITDFDGGFDFVASVAVQQDGRIVAVGGLDLFKAARYEVDGSLDESFGTGGRATVPIPSTTSSRAFAVAIQPDGKILIAGLAGSQLNLALARLNPDGSLDTTFGDGGTVLADPPLNGMFANDLALQPDGGIVIALRGVDFGVMRLHGDGTVDGDFGNGGLVVTDVSDGHDDRSTGVALQPDGTILLAGTASLFTANRDVAIAHYLANGELNTGFGDGGFTVTDGTNNENGLDVVHQPPGRVVVGGNRDEDFLLLGYIAGGLLFADGFESGDTSAWSATVP